MAESRPTDRPRSPAAETYKSVARTIGSKLRDLYDNPEGEPLPAEHVNLLLALRHKERDRTRTNLFA